MAPAPDAVMELMCCGCKGKCENRKCFRVKNNLPYTLFVFPVCPEEWDNSNNPESASDEDSDNSEKEDEDEEGDDAP